MKPFFFFGVFICVLNAHAQKIDSILVEVDNNPNWEYFSTDKYTYDVNGHLINLLTKNYGAISSPTPEWYPYYSTDYTYDLDSNVVLETTQWWNPVTTFWEVQRQSINTYDVNQNMTEKLVQNWNGSTWENSMRYTYTYDIITNYRTSYVMEVWQSTSWSPWSQVTYTNDINGLVLEWVQEEWNSGLSAMEITNKGTYVYTAFNEVSQFTSQYWLGSSWENDYRLNYTYDADNYLINYKWLDWNETINIWENYYQRNYTNNAAGVIEYFITQYWDEFSLVWNNAKKYTYSYLPYLAGIEEQITSPKELFKIYDLTGRETTHQKNKILIYQYSDGTTKKVFEVD